ncbi:hypothetical protein DSO57_1016942 [Entomophthora muscae]|uniref:Uncharacterized protein n=1 Tax=Entomophthora muscae TaxID=34485 RepID=A0ACC2TG15_9FUNG|nr:hypothetical protein DSO57_1016942 [Entomophthora muscae]
MMGEKFVSSRAGMWWIDALQVATALASFSLNGILLLCNYRRGKNRWTTDGILITINALLDCVISFTLILNAFIRLGYPALVYDGSTWCRISFINEEVLGAVCLNLVTVLALARYLIIVRGYNPHPMAWTFVALFVALVASFTLSFRVVEAQLYVYPAGMYCYLIAPQLGVLTPFSIVCFLLYVPHLFIIPYCYLRLSYHYSRVMNRHVCEFDASYRLKQKILGLIVVIVVYWLSLIPYITVSSAIRYFHFAIPPLADGLIYWLKCCFILINALFPILFHAEIQANFNLIFNLKKDSDAELEY